MARQPTTPTDDALSEAEASIAESAESFSLRYLKGGSWRTKHFRSFPECHAAASLCGDPRAMIMAQSAGQKASIPRERWSAWAAALAAE